MDKYLFKDHFVHKHSADIFENSDIDVNKLYEQGFISNKVIPSLNKKLLKLFKKLSFDEYHMDSITHGKGTEYSFNKNGLPPMVSLLVDKIYSEFGCVLSMFDIEECPLGIEVAVCKLSEGYYVDWHQDCTNQAVISFCMVINEEDFEEGEGGVLQFSKVKYDSRGSIIDREVIGSFPTNNSGQIVFFTPSDLNHQHRCTEIKTTKTRYLVCGIIGEIG
ncbi:2OG-Fe(II) oxygenase family protein [Vibrio parahaemolyticus]|uniref:2OG-Fe(II) oxygenase family protein n=1 Tax=Vibrio parahaemolyticus TaxID=670 RepID=UPI00235EEAF6|nr:2OG-Fe(II) oxygenase family protein [Vibrio parahaemolyticus]